MTHGRTDIKSLRKIQRRFPPLPGNNTLAAPGFRPNSIDTFQGSAPTRIPPHPRSTSSPATKHFLPHPRHSATQKINMKKQLHSNSLRDAEKRVEKEQRPNGSREPLHSPKTSRNIACSSRNCLSLAFGRGVSLPP